MSYSIPFYRPTTLQPASRLDSKTFLTEFIQWTIFPTYGGRFFPFSSFLGGPFFRGRFFCGRYFRGRFFLYSHFQVLMTSSETHVYVQILRDSVYQPLLKQVNFD